MALNSGNLWRRSSNSHIGTLSLARRTRRCDRSAIEMRYLALSQLEQLNAILGNVETIDGCRITGRLEAYSCKGRALPLRPSSRRRLRARASALAKRSQIRRSRHGKSGVPNNTRQEATRQGRRR